MPAPMPAFAPVERPPLAWFVGCPLWEVEAVGLACVEVVGLWTAAVAFVTAVAEVGACIGLAAAVVGALAASDVGSGAELTPPPACLMRYDCTAGGSETNQSGVPVASACSIKVDAAPGFVIATFSIDEGSTAISDADAEALYSDRYLVRRVLKRRGKGLRVEIPPLQLVRFWSRHAAKSQEHKNKGQHRRSHVREVTDDRISKDRRGRDQNLSCGGSFLFSLAREDIHTGEGSIRC